MKSHLPNQITLSRLVLSAFCFVLLSRFNLRAPNAWLLDVALAIFIIAAVTDWLDGYLARHLDAETALGRILDPFVDKILVCGAFIFFIGPNFVDQNGENITAIAPWMVVVVIAREMLVTSLRSYAESVSQAFGADGFGKSKTVVQLITVSYIMLFVAHLNSLAESGVFNTIKVALVWLSVVLTAASGINYLIKARHLLMGEQDGSNKTG